MFVFVSRRSPLLRYQRFFCLCGLKLYGWCYLDECIPCVYCQMNEWTARDTRYLYLRVKVVCITFDDPWESTVTRECVQNSASRKLHLYLYSAVAARLRR